MFTYNDLAAAISKMTDEQRAQEVMSASDNGVMTVKLVHTITDAVDLDANQVVLDCSPTV